MHACWKTVFYVKYQNGRFFFILDSNNRFEPFFTERFLAIISSSLSLLSMFVSCIFTLDLEVCIFWLDPLFFTLSLLVFLILFINAIMGLELVFRKLSFEWFPSCNCLNFVSSEFMKSPIFLFDLSILLNPDPCGMIGKLKNEFFSLSSCTISLLGCNQFNILLLVCEMATWNLAWSSSFSWSLVVY